MSRWGRITPLKKVHHLPESCPKNQSKYPSLKLTASSPLKKIGRNPKRKQSCHSNHPFFRGKLAVSFREGKTRFLLFARVVKKLRLGRWQLLIGFLKFFCFETLRLDFVGLVDVTMGFCSIGVNDEKSIYLSIYLSIHLSI